MIDKYMEKPLFGVNGVTFDNEEKDGGLPRQFILKTLFDTYKLPENVAIKNCAFRRDDYEGEFAVKILVDDIVIGYVPRDYLPVFLDDNGEPRKEIPEMKAKCEIGKHPQNESIFYALIGL